MRKRDKDIINSLTKFRCLSRDDIISLHFPNVKDGVKAANDVMRRLRDRGEVEVIQSTGQYVYACKPSPIKRDSQKIPHYLKVAGVYRDMVKFGGQPRYIEIEPKYEKGMPEPDIFAVWAGLVLWVEVQRSVYSEKAWGEKFARYKALQLRQDIWTTGEWQNKDKPIWPLLLILSESRVAVPEEFTKAFPIVQAQDLEGAVRILSRR